LVAQGRNDPRVPVEESRQIVAAVRRNDVPVWYMEADNEGHRFQRVDNLLVWHAAVVMFLRAYLLANKQ